MEPGCSPQLLAEGLFIVAWFEAWSRLLIVAPGYLRVVADLQLARIHQAAEGRAMLEAEDAAEFMELHMTASKLFEGLAGLGTGGEPIVRTGEGNIVERGGWATNKTMASSAGSSGSKRAPRQASLPVAARKGATDFGGVR